MNDDDIIFDMSAPVQRVAIKVPPFYRRNTSAWFKTLESQFKLARITSEETRFHYLVANLPEDIAALLLTESTQEHYSDLKAEVISAVEKTKQEKINDLFDITDIGDDKPSIFLRKLITKMENCNITATNDELTQRLLRCLPASVSTPLRAFQDLSPHRIAAIADSMLINTVPTPPPAMPSASLHQVKSSFVHHCDSDQNSSGRPNRGLQPFHEGQRPKICRAHIFYGSNARSCRPWCQFPSGSGSKAQLRYLASNEQTPIHSRAASPERRHEGN